MLSRWPSNPMNGRIAVMVQDLFAAGVLAQWINRRTYL